MSYVQDDSMVAIAPYSVVCARCFHLIDNGVGRKCKAFKEIPMSIWEGKNDHTEPYKGDNGIRFEPIEQK